MYIYSQYNNSADYTYIPQINVKGIRNWLHTNNPIGLMVWFEGEGRGLGSKVEISNHFKIQNW